MTMPLAAVWELLAIDKASPVFGRVAASANAAATSTERAMAKYNSAVQGMGRTGATLTRKLTLPLAAIGAVAIKSATDFNSSMTRIQTQAGASAKDVRYLSKAVLGMKDVQYGPNQLAQALYHLKSVGLDNVQAMKALRVSTNLAAVGGANLEETTNALAGAWRTGIRGARNFHDAAATVNAIIGAGNMTLEQFNAALGTGILPSAKTFGLTLKDVGSALALFTDEGVSADSAATRLRMSFSLLGAPSMAAEKILSGIGLSGQQLGDALRKPNGLINAIGLLKSHLEGMNNYYPNPTKAAEFVAAMKATVTPLLNKKNLDASQQALVNQYGMAKEMHLVLQQGKLDATEQAAVLSRAFGGGRSSSAILSLINNFDVLKKKQDQVTNSLNKYDQAVKVQQATPQAKFQEALANLQKAGILLGQQLLPIATSIAEKLAGIAQGFNNLSSGQKKMITEAGLALFALGPVLSILAKIGQVAGFVAKGVIGMSRAFATLNMSARLAGSAMGGFVVGSAISNAAAGKGYGGHTGKALLSVLGSAGAGAATGAVFGGLPGAAVGGIAGTIGGVIGVFHHLNYAAQQNAAIMQQAMQANLRWTLMFKGTVDGLASSLHAVNGAMSQQYRNEIIRQLSQSGVLNAAANAGLKGTTVVSAALGQTSAATYSKVASALGRVNRDAERSFIDLGHAAGGAEKKFELEQAAAGKSIIPTKLLGVTVKDLSKALNTNNKFLDDGSQTAARNSAIIQENVKALLAARDAEIKHGGSVLQADSAYREQIQTLAKNLTQLGFNRQAVINLISAIDDIPKSESTKLLAADLASAKIKTVQKNVDSLHGKTIEISARAQGNFAKMFINQGSGIIAGTGVHFQKDGGLLRGPGGPRTDSIPVMASNGEYVVNARATSRFLPLLEKINGYKDGGIVMNVAASKILNQLAGGGVRAQVPGMGSYTGGGSLAAWARDAVTIAGFPTSWIPAIIRRAMFESGGNPNAINLTDSNAAAGHPSKGLMQTIDSTFGAYEMRGYGNIWNPVDNIIAALRYIRSRYGSIFNIDPPVQGYAGGAWNIAQDQTARIHKGEMVVPSKTAKQIRDYIVSGPDGDKHYSTKRSAIDAMYALVRTLNTAMRQLAVHEIPSFAKSITKTGGDVRTAFGTILGTLRELGASREAMHRLTLEDNRLAAMVNARNAASQQLQALQQARRGEVGNIRGAVNSYFSLASSGTGPTGSGKPAFGSIYAQALQDRNIVRKWASGLRKLAKVFGKSVTGKRMLARLAEAGPDSWPQVQALVAADPKQLRNLVATETQIGRIGQSVGQFVGGELYNQRIGATRTAVRRDEREVVQALHRIERVLERDTHRTERVTLVANGKKIASLVAEGNKRNARRS